jgi:hypothetical protein
MARPDYLRVDAFVKDAVGARALATAFELGLIDRIAAGATDPFLHRRVDPAGAGLLMGALRDCGVIEGGEQVRLSRAFLDALAHRDLLEAKLDTLGAFHDRAHTLRGTHAARPGRPVRQHAHARCGRQQR